MLVSFPHAGPSMKGVQVYPAKALIEKPKALRFSGVADEFRNSKTEQTRKYYQDVIARNQRLLTNDIMPVGDRSLNGLQMLKLIKELSDKTTWSFTAGDLKGTKLVWVFEMNNLLYPKELQDKVQLWFRTALEKLSNSKLIGWDTQPSTAEQHGGSWYVYLTPLGANTLNEINRMESEGTLKALLQIKPAETEKVIPDNAKVKTVQGKLDQLRYLIGKQVDDLTGWDVLRKLVKADENRYAIARYLSPGLRDAQWRKKVDITNLRAFKAALPQLNEMGVLTVKGEGASARWAITERAREMAGCSDVSEAMEMTRDDYKQFFKSEIDQIEAEKKTKLQQIQGFDEQYQADVKTLETLKASLDTKKQGVLQAHEAAKQEPDTTQSAKMLAQVSEQLMELDLLGQEVQARQEQLQQRKGQSDAAKVFFTKWRQQTHLRTQKLQQLLFQVETTEVNKGINQFLAEMQAMEKQEGQDGLNALLTPLVETVQVDYHVSKEQVEQSDLGLKMAEEKAYQTMQLDAAIAQLKSEQAGKRQPVKSEAGSDALKDLAAIPQANPDSVQAKVNGDLK